MKSASMHDILPFMALRDAVALQMLANVPADGMDLTLGQLRDYSKSGYLWGKTNKPNPFYPYETFLEALRVTIFIHRHFDGGQINGIPVSQPTHMMGVLCNDIPENLISQAMIGFDNENYGLPVPQMRRALFVLSGGLDGEYEVKSGDDLEQAILRAAFLGQIVERITNINNMFRGGNQKLALFDAGRNIVPISRSVKSRIDTLQAEMRQAASVDQAQIQQKERDIAESFYQDLGSKICEAVLAHCKDTPVVFAMGASDIGVNPGAISLDITRFDLASVLPQGIAPKIIEFMQVSAGEHNNIFFLREALKLTASNPYG